METILRISIQDAKIEHIAYKYFFFIFAPDQIQHPHVLRTDMQLELLLPTVLHTHVHDMINIAYGNEHIWPVPKAKHAGGPREKCYLQFISCLIFF